jgi:hypothetical protein
MLTSASIFQKVTLIEILFVDDGLACCASEAKLAELIIYMERHFSITKSSADLYVGLHIYRDSASQCFTSTRPYICNESWLDLDSMDVHLSAPQQIQTSSLIQLHQLMIFSHLFYLQQLLAVSYLLRP